MRGMDCSEALHQLYHYLDGELPESTRLSVVAHLEYCPPCVQVVVFEVELRRIVAKRCREEPPGELRHRIARAIGVDLPTE